MYSTHSDEDHSLGILVFAKVLLGSRVAIERLAASKQGIPLGLLLVASAALAREYDQEYLAARPAVLLIPFIASFFSASLLFAFARLVVGFDRLNESMYGPFLALFWSTAPLAWLYAIPYERFLSPYGATLAALMTLTIVSLWRVILATRFLSVLSGFRFLPTASIVLCFSSAILFVIGFQVTMSLAGIMSGVQLSPEQSLVGSFAAGATSLSFLGFPVFLIATGIVRWKRRSCLVEKAEFEPMTVSFSSSIWFLALAMPVGFGFAAIGPQKELGRQEEYTNLLRREEFDQALQYASQFDRADFPPHWNPGWQAERPSKLDLHPQVCLAKAALAESVPSWLREPILDDFRSGIREVFTWRSLGGNETIGVAIEVLERIPDGPSLAAEILLELDQFEDEPESEEIRSRLQQIVNRKTESPG